MTTQVSTTFVTREEFRAAIDELNARVQGLYNLADRLGYSVDVPEVNSVPEAQSDADRPSVHAPVELHPNGSASGVDYRAVAYGLTTLKTKIENHLGRSTFLDNDYRDMVRWFVACFEGDASFNAEDFRGAAGV